MILIKLAIMKILLFIIIFLNRLIKQKNYIQISGISINFN